MTRSARAAAIVYAALRESKSEKVEELLHKLYPALVIIFLERLNLPCSLFLMIEQE